MAEEVIQETSSIQPPEEEVKAKHDLLIFWLRMVGWLATGVGAPITVFAIKFGLFNEYGYAITTDDLGNVTGMHVALNGWGIVSVILITWALSQIISEIIDAYTNKYSFTKQVLMGIKDKIIPLVIAIGVCVFLKGCIDQVIFCLVTIGISQLAAIALNPLPKWKYEKKGVEDYHDLLSGLTQLLKERKKGAK